MKRRNVWYSPLETFFRADWNFLIVNIGKWVLRNLFIGFIREEQRTRKRGSEVSESGDSASALFAPSLTKTPLPSQNANTASLVAWDSTDSTQNSYHSRHSHSYSHSHLHSHTKSESSSGDGKHHDRRTSLALSFSTSADHTRKIMSTPTTSTIYNHLHLHRQSTSRIVVESTKLIPAVIPPNVPGSVARNSPFIVPLIPLKTKDGLSRRPQTATGNFGEENYTDRDVTTPGSTQGDHFGPRIRHVSLQGQLGVEEAAAAGDMNANTPTAAMVDNVVMTPKLESQNPLSAGGLMGKLRNLGRSTMKRPTSDMSCSVGMSPALGGVISPSVVSTAVEVYLFQIVPDGWMLISYLLNDRQPVL